MGCAVVGLVIEPRLRQQTCPAVLTPRRPADPRAGENKMAGRLPGHPTLVLVNLDQPPVRVTVQITPDLGTV
jgi:hypothetical protein